MNTPRALSWIVSLPLLFSVAALGFGCKSTGPKTQCAPGCEGDRGDCESCCILVPDSMQADCVTSCECAHTCCMEECGYGLPGACDNCYDPGFECYFAFTTDDDQDGFNEYEGDCDDDNPNMNPDLPELPGDGLDNDCNGITDADFDGDGFTVQAGDCDDEDRLIHPDMPENCLDEIDNNCNDEINEGCPSPCELAAQNRSSVGCVYYAIDNNAIAPGDYAVSVSNVHSTDTADVVIEVKEGTVWNVVSGGSFSVGPLSLHTLVLPHRSISGSAIQQGGAYRITSDLPVIAYQFNPVDGSSSYLSDASLLLPDSAFDTHYLVPAWPYGPADMSPSSGWPAHIQVVAMSTTEVRITSPIVTEAGSIPSLTPGVPTPFNLEEGDVLQVTVANWMESFAGTYVESDQPVAVFTSNDCANVPASGDYCCCEHLEEQVFGLQTWGKKYVASRVPMRQSEPALWQILAHQDDTTVTFNAHADIGLREPVGPMPTNVVLNNGDIAEYLVGGSASNPGDFVITADKPILVVQYMVAAFMVGPGSDDGDPSMVQAVPVEQFLDQYVVLVPDTWINDYLVLTRPVGATVSVDGQEVATGWVPVGSGIDPVEYEVARVPVSDGVHVLTGTAAFGVIVIGYDHHDSYAYPGGLNQQIINPVR